MEGILEGLPLSRHSNLLLGFETRDDAGIYRINDETALIQTVDFFTPMVDDPYLFGQIAACNAINDVYAMGGKPLTAMNIVCFPQCEDLLVLRRIIEGGLSIIHEAGAVLLGGHTVDDQEPKYGLAVTGQIHPEKIIMNRGARTGDNIYITKPIGNGIISTALKAGLSSPAASLESVKWMVRLNKELPEVAKVVPVHAATDVTGFGLLGHLMEMAQASDVFIELTSEIVPLMESTMEYASWGLIPAGAYTNRDFLWHRLSVSPEINPVLLDILCSPETAGGLLIAVEPAYENEVKQIVINNGSLCVPIARVLDSGFKPLRLV